MYNCKYLKGCGLYFNFVDGISNLKVVKYNKNIYGLELLCLVSEIFPCIRIKEYIFKGFKYCLSNFVL